jgi:hypothetical protein
MLLLLLLLVLSSRNAGGGGRFSRLPFATLPIPLFAPFEFWWMTELLEIDEVRRIGGGGLGTWTELRRRRVFLIVLLGYPASNKLLY